MLKLAAELLFAAAALMTGFSASLSLKKRRDALTSFVRAVGICRSEIRYRRTETGRILSNLVGLRLPALGDFIASAAEGACVPEKLPRSLSDEEKGIILRFFTELGTSGAGDQETLCEAAEQEGARLRAEAEKNYSGLAKLYLELGALAAAVIAILLT